MASRTLEITFIGDSKPVTKAFGEVDDAGGKLSGKLGALGQAFGGVAKIAGGIVVAEGLLKLPGLMGGFVSSASDLNESMSKVNVVFGSQAVEIEKWASSAAKNLGMTKGAALEASGTFGNFLQAMGATTPEATEMSKTMVQLATDLGSFNNADPEEVILALRSGLSGEAEPMKKFGVALSEAAVQAKGAELGLGNLGKEMSEQEKIQARYAIIMEQTKTAQGDFARTSGGMANQVKILKASFGDVSAQLGTALLPGIQKLLAALIQVLPVAIAFGQELGAKLSVELAKLKEPAAAVGAFITDTLIPAMQELGERIAPVASALADDLAAAFGFVTDHSDELIAAVTGIGTAILVMLVPSLLAWVAAEWAKVAAMTASAAAFLIANAPLIAIAAVIAAVVAAIVIMIQHWDEITEKVPALGVAMDAVKAGLEAVVGWVTGSFVPSFTAGFGAVIGWITGTFVPTAMRLGEVIGEAGQKAVGFIQEHWGTIEGILRPFVEAWQALFEAAFSNIQTVIETALGVVKGIFNTFMGVFTGDWDRAWNGIKDTFGAIWTGLKALAQTGIELLKDLIPIALGIGKDILTGLWDGITWVVTTWLWPFFEGLPGNVLGFFTGAISWLYDIGKDILQGLWDGMKNVWESAKGWLDGLGDKIKGAFTNPLKVFSPSRVMMEVGKDIIDGLAVGMEEGWHAITPMLNGFAEEVKNTLAAASPFVDVNTGKALPDYVIPNSPYLSGLLKNPGALMYDAAPDPNVSAPSLPGGINWVWTPGVGWGPGAKQREEPPPLPNLDPNRGASEVHLHLHTDGIVVGSMEELAGNIGREFARAY